MTQSDTAASSDHPTAASEADSTDGDTADARAAQSQASTAASLDRSGPVQPAIRLMLMPKDTNGMGTIFGGIILSYIDLAGAVEARRYCLGTVVTAAMREVEFHEPVFVGDLVSFYTETVRVGRTSVTTRVLVEAERKDDGVRVKVTEAEVVYVHVGPDREPRPLEPERVRAAGLTPAPPR